jgi:hypothetical protein
MEVNSYWNEFCPEDQLTYLFSYQIRNILMCIDIFVDIQKAKVTSIYNKSIKGARRKRPFSFNQIKNLFESRY